MTYLHKTRWWLAALLVALAPFHAFLITWIKSSEVFGMPLLIISGWREIIVVAICGLGIIEYITERVAHAAHSSLSGPRNGSASGLLDWLIIAYIGLTLVFLPFQWENKMQWLWGFRFDVLPFVFYLAVKNCEWRGVKKLTVIALASATVVVVFGLAHALFLPQDFLSHFGYSNYQGLYQPDIAISGCQYLEHTDRVCRAISTFGGPTRYGTYLLLALGLLLPLLWQKGKSRIFAVALGSLTLISVILTFSRSIWIGLATATVAGIFLLAKHSQKYAKQIKIAGTALAVLALIAVAVFSLKFATDTQKDYYQQFIKSIFVRSSSTNEHVELAKIGIQTAVSHPLGIGLGTVGPASLHFRKFLTENWYLQITDEMGVIGLALFLGILFFISKKLLSRDGTWAEKGLFLSLLGIAVAGLFTHSFEETSTVLILMAFAGMTESDVY